MKRRKEADPINPSYYKGDTVMRIIEDFGLDFCLGTVVKYILRAGNKHAEGKRVDDAKLVDLRKAVWYLERAIANLEKSNETSTLRRLTSHRQSHRRV